MSRSALTTWNQRVQKRLARATGQSPLSPEALEAAVELVARKMRVDPIILMGALAAKPIPTALWNEVLHGLGPQPPPREEDWSAMATAAEVVSHTFPGEMLLGWVVEPSQPADVYLLASCLALHAPAERLDLLATHSDPRMVEIGRSGLLPDTTVARLPAAMQERFRHLGRCWQVAPELRAAVRFECAPACELPGMQHPSSGGYHLVVSRGQLVRLESGVARRLAQRLYRSLRAHGFLFVGPGDHDDRLFGEFEPLVAPGVLLYRKGQVPHPETRSVAGDFAALLSAVESDPTAWEPRWQLACLLLREGYAESAMSHLRELARWRPEFPGVWHTLAKAYTLAGNTAAAETAHARADLAATSAGAPKMLM